MRFQKFQVFLVLHILLLFLELVHKHLLLHSMVFDLKQLPIFELLQLFF